MINTSFFSLPPLSLSLHRLSETFNLSKYFTLQGLSVGLIINHLLPFPVAQGLLKKDVFHLSLFSCCLHIALVAKSPAERCVKILWPRLVFWILGVLQSFTKLAPLFLYLKIYSVCCHGNQLHSSEGMSVVHHFGLLCWKAHGLVQRHRLQVVCPRTFCSNARGSILVPGPMHTAWNHRQGVKGLLLETVANHQCKCCVSCEYHAPSQCCDWIFLGGGGRAVSVCVSTEKSKCLTAGKGEVQKSYYSEQQKKNGRSSVAHCPYESYAIEALACFCVAIMVKPRAIQNRATPLHHVEILHILPWRISHCSGMERCWHDYRTDRDLSED